jgi:hypothetical protein
MSDAPEPIAFTLPLTLPDYVALRAYYLRRYVARNSLIFFGFLIIGALVIPPLSGVPVRLMLRILERNWLYYAAIVLGVFLLVRLLPFVSLLALWFRGTLPRQIAIQATEEGIGYTLFDTDILLHWAAISSVKNTREAYYVNSKARIVRLPKRDIAPGQRAAFEKLVARHIRFAGLPP